MTTADTHGARSHARSQGGTVVDGMPFVPATSYPDPPADAPPRSLVWAEHVPAGRYTTKVLARGTRLRMIDRDGTACAHLMLWRAGSPWERLNVADTVKVPWQAYLGTGHPLLSDQGRVLATIVADTSGRHDAICGASTLADNQARYGAGEPESLSPAARALLVLAAQKNGLGPRDVPPTPSFFHGVTVDGDGGLRSTGSAGPGAYVDIVLHLPTIVAVANAAHPLDPADAYPDGTLQLFAWPDPGELTGRASRIADLEPEYQRAFQNTEDAWNSLNWSLA
ncbi:urea amidolyase associated protein UAAP1 [Tsukamurella soli]|uniref:Urea carboxylase-associated family protein n=1 Tax=Tsukamurella soli TaxID=644556 RepID=A0ABP8JDG7_9ACTN